MRKDFKDVVILHRERLHVSEFQADPWTHALTYKGVGENVMAEFKTIPGEWVFQQNQHFFNTSCDKFE